MWGPCFVHKRALFWQFLGKGDYGVHPEFWSLAWIIPRHIDYDSRRNNLKEQVRTMFWPWRGHILAISREKGLWDTPRIVKFGMEHPWAHWSWFRKNQFEGPCEAHVFALKGPYFLPYLYKHATRFTFVKFGMEHLWVHWIRFRKNQIEGLCEDHVLTIKGKFGCF